MFALFFIVNSSDCIPFWYYCWGSPGVSPFGVWLNSFCMMRAILYSSSFSWALSSCISSYFFSASAMSYRFSTWSFANSLTIWIGYEYGSLEYFLIIVKKSCLKGMRTKLWRSLPLSSSLILEKIRLWPKLSSLKKKDYWPKAAELFIRIKGSW